MFNNRMPIGIIVDCISVFIGGILGFTLKSKLPDRIKEALPNVFGVAALALGINLIIQVKSLSAVALALILGTMIGETFSLFNKLGELSEKLNTILNKNSKNHDSEFDSVFFISAVVLFCSSGTGIFGALNEGLTGDYSILFVKSILDFFTAMIFATSMGIIISFICIPQIIIFSILFYTAIFIMPLVNEEMLLDFKACGGLITLTAGLNILKIKQIKILNLVPALIVVMPISYFWMTYIVTLF